MYMTHVQGLHAVMGALQKLVWDDKPAVNINHLNIISKHAVHKYYDVIKLART